MTFVRNLKLTILLLLLSPLLILLKIIRPIIEINFGLINSERIGKYVVEYSQAKIIDSNKKKKCFNFFYLSGKSSNKFFDKIVKRNLYCNSVVRYIYLANKFSKDFFKLDFNKKNSLNNRDDDGIISKSDFKLEFTDEENYKCQEFLSKIGYTPKKKLVCLIVRDQKYLELKFPHIDWSYHTYRNADVKTFSKSIEWLTQNNFFVLLMGENTNQEFKSFNENFIDYSKNVFKSDMLDIWLFANCSLCISTGTGIDFVSLINKRPIFFNNYIPISNFISYAKSYTVPKSLFWEHNNQELSLNEYLEHNYENSYEYQKNKILIYDLTADELLKELEIYVSLINKNEENNSLTHNKIFIDTLKDRNNLKSNNSPNFNFFHKESFISPYWFNRVSNKNL